jgi:hypothetical protein
MVFGIIALVVAITALVLVFVFRAQLRKEIEANKKVVEVKGGRSFYTANDTY